MHLASRVGHKTDAKIMLSRNTDFAISRAVSYGVVASWKGREGDKAFQADLWTLFLGQFLSQARSNG